jgi:hypothetical protein
MEAKQPTQSFEFVCEWFERAAKNAKAQGKSDAAALWEDGLAQIKHLAAQRDAALLNAKQRIDACIKDGPLQGDGWDKTAERNGLILASNILTQMMRGAA